jgi:beta-mannosidase
VTRSSADVLAGARWRCAATEPGSVTHPDALDTVTDWVTASVPGTVVGALRESQSDAGRAKQFASPSASSSVESSDWWFVTTAATTGEGSWLLQFDGLTAFADVWIDGVLVASSESMFAPGEVSIPAGVGVGERVRVAIHFHSLAATLKARRPRGRWRSSMVREQGLRWIRTTMLGLAPVFSGVPVPVGPWRGIRLLDKRVAAVTSVSTQASVHGTTGRVAISARLTGLPASLDYVTVRVGEHSQRLAAIAGPDGFHDVSGVVEVADAQLWWPHTHGAPCTYPVTLETDGVSEHLGSVGFRTVEVDRSDGGFRLIVNGIGVYCRGSVWVPTDPISLQGDAGTTRVLEKLAEAGLNMVRIPGTMFYESDHFWVECARLGILVWQDMMLATLDPPDTDEFFELVAAEVTAYLRRVRGNPALAVFCGGSETEQQPTMLGLVDQHIPLIHSRLPELISTVAPELEYVSSSPSAPRGGEQLTTHVGSGVAHYFGVGAYRRPLADVLSARVRFATESLAFSIPPSRTNSVHSPSRGTIRRGKPRCRGTTDRRGISRMYGTTTSTRSSAKMLVKSGGPTRNAISTSDAQLSVRRSRPLSVTGVGRTLGATAPLRLHCGIWSPDRGGGSSIGTATPKLRGSCSAGAPNRSRSSSRTTVWTD